MDLRKSTNKKAAIARQPRYSQNIGNPMTRQKRRSSFGLTVHLTRRIHQCIIQIRLFSNGVWDIRLLHESYTLEMVWKTVLFHAARIKAQKRLSNTCYVYVLLSRGTKCMKIIKIKFVMHRLLFKTIEMSYSSMLHYKIYRSDFRLPCGCKTQNGNVSPL